MKLGFSPDPLARLPDCCVANSAFVVRTPKLIDTTSMKHFVFELGDVDISNATIVCCKDFCCTPFGEVLIKVLAKKLGLKIYAPASPKANTTGGS